jgi:hypothetical protein
MTNKETCDLCENRYCIQVEGQTLIYNTLSGTEFLSRVPIRNCSTRINLNALMGNGELIEKEDK